MGLRRLFAKIGNVFHRQRSEQDLVREVASHLAMLEDRFLRQGMTLDEARLAARRAYGGVEQAKELHRDERSLVWLEQLFQDLRHAFRSLRKSPVFLAVAMLSLAFGIGVNTSIFTLVNGILLKNLAVQDPHRIVQVVKRFDKSYVVEQFSFPVYRETAGIPYRQHDRDNEPRRNAQWHDGVHLKPSHRFGCRACVQHRGIHAPDGNAHWQHRFLSHGAGNTACDSRRIRDAFPGSEDLNDRSSDSGIQCGIHGVVLIQYSRWTQ